jgi:hypothetical protein
VTRHEFECFEGTRINHPVELHVLEGVELELDRSRVGEIEDARDGVFIRGLDEEHE